jgi:hypothetical protein
MVHDAGGLLSLAAAICRPRVSSKLNIVTMDVFQRHSMKPHSFIQVAGSSLVKKRPSESLTHKQISESGPPGGKVSHSG